MVDKFLTSVLSSGSKGNCFLVRYKNTQILIDVGVTFKYYANCMEILGLDPHKLDAIFISHEHSDHVGGAGVMHRKTSAPIYISQPTWVYSEKKIGKMTSTPIFFKTNTDFIVSELVVHPFSSVHDAIDGSNFLIFPVDKPDDKLAIVTDCGYSTNLLKNNLKKTSTIILESNHDVQMLKTGPYEWHLKQRILSRNGHLSNVQASDLIDEIVTEQHKRIILAHLSEINNTPDIAYKQMKSVLDKKNFKVDLQVSGQYEATALYEV